MRDASHLHRTRPATRDDAGGHGGDRRGRVVRGRQRTGLPARLGGRGVPRRGHRRLVGECLSTGSRPDGNRGTPPAQPSAGRVSILLARAVDLGTARHPRLESDDRGSRMADRQPLQPGGRRAQPLGGDGGRVARRICPAFRRAGPGGRRPGSGPPGPLSGNGRQKGRARNLHGLLGCAWRPARGDDVRHLAHGHQA